MWPNWPGSSTPPATSSRRPMSEKPWPRLLAGLRGPGGQAALTARANERADSLARTLANRVEDEVKTMRQVLGDLRTSITRQLEELEEPEQLMLFERSEREQFSRDLDALRARVESIPAEIDAEEAAIRSRYSNRPPASSLPPSPSSCPAAWPTAACQPFLAREDVDEPAGRPPATLTGSPWSTRSARS